MKRAFTLTEVVVVIALICVFAALLFPVFERVREQGRGTGQHGIEIFRCIHQLCERRGIGPGAINSNRTAARGRFRWL